MTYDQLRKNVIIIQRMTCLMSSSFFRIVFLSRFIDTMNGVIMEILMIPSIGRLVSKNLEIGLMSYCVTIERDMNYPKMVKF